MNAPTITVCSRCLYTSLHPLYITFDGQGVCSGCRIHEEKDTLDWGARLELLKNIVAGYKNTSGRNYDCIVPVSGARDSYFIVHVVKNVLGLNPLLVTYNKHYNTDVGIRNLANLRIRFNCDIFTQTVNPETVKKITRATLRRLGSMYWHCLAGQTVYPVQMAVKFKIPLIIWGVHQGIDQVGMFSHTHEVEMTRKYRKEHDLMGLEAEDLVNDFDNITEQDILPYVYPHDQLLEQVGVRGIYLNNYIRWDSKVQHEEMIQQYGYESAELNRTFDRYNDVDCFNYADVHDYIKYIKHGYGKVTDHACREIRLKRLSREEAVNLVKQYQYREPVHLQKFLQWIDIDETAFHFLMDQHRNPLLWKRDASWNWSLQIPALEDIQPEKSSLETNRLPLQGPMHFQLTENKRPGYSDDQYILIGKGYYTE